MYRILIADDEVSMLKGIEFNLQENPEYEVFTASNREEAFKILAAHEIDLVVSDLMMPDIEDGISVMREARSQWYNPVILAMTAFDTVDNAVKAMKAGADDFIPKGFGLAELGYRIESMLKKKIQITQLSTENQILKETIQKQYSDYNIIGKSKQMTEVVKRLQKVAGDATVTCLIHGESGTGKELIARTIHANSVRKNAPFVPVNCAAIPENLIESELFGHEKGSFTGAYTSKQGKFELAGEGIIFLDEIGELPLPLQVRLLRVLEERSFYRIGGKNPIDVNVMILSATNQDLAKLVEAGKFREDLYFRLNVTKITIAPLRERKQDIRLLARFFLEKFNNERRKKLKFSEEALLMLELYEFPGNVRELRNIIEDAFVFCEGQVIGPHNISLRQLTKPMPESASSEKGKAVETELLDLSHSEAVEKFEKQYFMNILQKTFWNLGDAATKAGMSREWLSIKIRRLKIKRI